MSEGLTKLGHEVVVYANGGSEVSADVRWIYPRDQWPVKGDFPDTLKEITHTAWALRDAADSCDIIHVNNFVGLPFSEFTKTPIVLTIHHEHQEALSSFYMRYPDAHYVTISEFQRRQELMPNLETIHHGIDLSHYEFCSQKEKYFSFLGRVAPIKGTHIAVRVAQETGIPLKIAGEIQPIFRDYYESEIEPHVDGKLIEYVGEADLAAKNELLRNSLALLFPIQWNEPFGLVMIEAMACGTPVLALPGGSVPEVIQDGVSGYVCQSIKEMVRRARDVESWIRPEAIRRYTEKRFSMERMALDYEQLYDAISCPATLRSQPQLLETSDAEPTAA